MVDAGLVDTAAADGVAAAGWAVGCSEAVDVAGYDEYVGGVGRLF